MFKPLKKNVSYFFQNFQSPYGEPVEPEKAPEAISKAVASLPPEQMFELMKQMKVLVSQTSATLVKKL